MSSSKFSLIIMHDNGETHRVRMSRGWLRVLIILAVLLPVVGLLGFWMGADAWMAMSSWRQEKISFLNQVAELNVKVQRMENISALLKEKPKQEPATSTDPVPAAPASPAPAPIVPEVPHLEVTTDLASDVLINDTAGLKIENLQARIIDKRRIRASVDLYNTDSAQKLLSGRTIFTLITADGHKYPLTNEDALFKITRFKKVITNSPLPVGVEQVENAAILVEVLIDDKVVYRNYFSIESK